jgi:hypothetical protein
MAKSGKNTAAKKAAPQAQVEPAWDKATWMSLSNVRLGVPAFVVAGALHARAAHVKLTEAEVRRCLQDFLNQSL